MRVVSIAPGGIGGFPSGMCRGEPGISSADESIHPLSLPSMRSWIEALSKGADRAVGFETRIGWSLCSAAKTILGRLEGLGCRPVTKAQRCVVQGKCGPPRDGELERAKAWGAELAQAESEKP